MAASPATSAGSPPALAPAPATMSMRPSAITPVAAIHSGPATPTSVTSREWVVPPRPKPGRKPATDTPPTKRKAQNRAAQRAFRERRAAKIGELEGCIDEIKEKHENEKFEFESKISGLEGQVRRLHDEISFWQHRCQALGGNLEEEFKWKELWMRGQYLPKPSRRSDSMNDVVSLPPRKSTRKRPDDKFRSESSTPQESIIPASEEPAPLGCGKCTATSRCKCIEEAFNISNLTSTEDDASSSTPISPPKRPHSPQDILASKRSRSSPPDEVTKHEDLETDFTAAFSVSLNPLPLNKNPASNNAGNNSTVAESIEPCGFCEPGTTICVCAEMSRQTLPEQGPTRMAPGSLSQFTPPPSDGDVMTAPSKTRSMTRNPCANGPGTCAKCLADPNRTLFCKSLAASRARSEASRSRSTPAAVLPPKANSTPRLPSIAAITAPQNNNELTLTCTDTYTTLSRHPHFYEASDDMGAWIPKLAPIVTKDGEGQNKVQQRPMMEIEAASVMQTLRYFDRRWGSQ
ncbi:MAG: hypothetical protein M1834_004982 [Cirrosporium novae-zelandiae]|nr:MAG: hypothetical protein M1834_004982 [Cirrosporium novae-zelandiae]